MATLSKDGKRMSEGASVFRASLIELGLLGLLIPGPAVLDHPLAPGSSFHRKLSGLDRYC
jgi:hypothetical protein